MSASLSSAAPALARFPCQSGGMHSAALPCTGICRLLPRLLSAKQGARGRCKRLTTCIVRRPMYLLCRQWLDLFCVVASRGNTVQIAVDFASAALCSSMHHVYRLGAHCMRSIMPAKKQTEQDWMGGTTAKSTWEHMRNYRGRGASEDGRVCQGRCGRLIKEGRIN